jgi:hypothetical protein
MDDFLPKADYEPNKINNLHFDIYPVLFTPECGYWCYGTFRSVWDHQVKPFLESKDEISFIDEVTKTLHNEGHKLKNQMCFELCRKIEDKILEYDSSFKDYYIFYKLNLCLVNPKIEPMIVGASSV